MTDAMGAAMMIPHHQMGIEMAQMAADEQQAQLTTLQEIAESGGEEPMPPEAPLETSTRRRWLSWKPSPARNSTASGWTRSATTTGEAESLQQEIHDGQLEETQTMDELSQQLG